MEERAEELDEAAMLEEAVDLAIAACGGDHRAAVRALLVSNNYLHDQAEKLRDLISPGFVRGRLSLLDLP